MNRKEMQQLKSFEISDELGNKIKTMIKRIKWYQWGTMTYDKLKDKLFKRLNDKEQKEWNNIPMNVKEFMLMGNKQNVGGNNHE